jgi:GrpB-like predicted nucleotidyltransferase (UPF0157 family)
MARWHDGPVSRRTRPRRPDVTTVELVGGVEPLKVGLGDYDPCWVDVYHSHRDRIREAIPVEVTIEHIGSTAVPGLAAKPIVDICVVVDDITAEEDYLDPLLTAGYELRVREPGHRLMRTPARDVHVHLYPRGHPAIVDYLLLRDRLRSHSDERSRYERVKRSLIEQQWDDMNAYAEAKTEVISAIKARARAAREH